MAQNQTEAESKTIGNVVERKAFETVELRSDDLVAKAGTRGYSPRYWISSDVLELPSDQLDQSGSRNVWAALVSQFDGVAKIDEDAAEILYAVDDSVVFGVPLRSELVETVTDRDVGVPLRLVSEGKPLLAAYLRAHGWSNSKISHELDVSESTASQYVSDFKNGRR